MLLVATLTFLVAAVPCSAETSATIITVDGMDLWPGILPFYGVPLSEEPMYLEAAINSMELGSHVSVEGFEWTGDPDDSYITVTELREQINNLKEFLKSKSIAKSADEKLIVVSHSWGTFLTYTALSLEPSVHCDLYITLSPPLGSPFAGDLTPNYTNIVTTYIELAIYEMGLDWMFPILQKQAGGTMPATEAYEKVGPNIGVWKNFWAYGDIFSGPMIFYPPFNSEDTKLDRLFWPVGRATPLDTVYYTSIFHKYTSLQPGGSLSNEDLLLLIQSILRDAVGSPPPSGYLQPTITFSIPNALVTADDDVVIGWDAFDPDSTARITLYRDNNAYGHDGTPISGATDLVERDGYGAHIVWTKNLPENDSFYVYAVIDDGNTAAFSDNYTARIVVDHRDEDDDAFSFYKEWEEEDGDGDGVIEVGESAEINIRLRNNTGDEVTRVEAWLSTSATDVEISDNYEDYWTMAADETKWGDFEAVFDFIAATEVHFNLDITFERNGSPYYQQYSFSRLVPTQGTGPLFQKDHVVIDDSLEEAPWNDDDGVLESGESVEFDLYLQNIGTASAVEVQAKATDVKGQSVTFDVHEGWEDYPDLDAGGSAQKQSGDDFQDVNIPTYFKGTITADITVKYGLGQIEQVLPDVPLFDVQPEAWLYVTTQEHYFGVANTVDGVTTPLNVSNSGTKALTITAVSPSHSDTTWSGPPLPWTLDPGDSATIDVTVDTSALDGETITREVVVSSNGRVRDLGEDDRLIITGLVSDSLPVYKLTNAPGAEDPDVSGDWIVYTSSRNGNNDVFAYSISTDTEMQITANTANQYSPFISGGLIAWRDFRSDPIDQNFADIYGFDLNHPELGVFPVATSLENERLIGVDGSLIAFMRTYFVFDESERTNWDEAWDLVVYEYGDNASFTSRFDTNFPPRSGTNPLPSFSSTANFSGGLLVVGKQDIIWESEYGYWGEDDQHLEVIDFANGETSLRHSGLNSWYAPRAANEHQFVFVKDYEDPSGNEAEQIWLWDNGSIRRLTEPGDAEVDHADDALAFGGNYVVYNKDESVNAGKLFYWDLSANQSSYPEYLLSNQPGQSPETARMDGNTVVWRARDPMDSQWYLYYAFLGGDLTISSPDIRLDIPSPMDTDLFNVFVTVHNISRDPITEDILVSLYAGDPNMGGSQIGTLQTIPGGIPGRSQATVTFNGVLLDEGPATLFAACSGPSSEPTSNNMASKSVTVLDSDTDAPIISDVVIQENGGDGDGHIEDNESARISWTVSDDSGVGETACRLDGVLLTTEDGYESVAEPMEPGKHTVVLSASDADSSAESTELTITFDVYCHAPVVLNASPTGSSASRQSTIQIIFADSIAPSSVTLDAFQVSAPGTGIVQGSISYLAAERGLVFRPALPLDYSTQYTALLTSGAGGVTDKIGNHLESDYVWSFTTVADTTDPVANIGAPVGGDILYGQVAIWGTAYDDNLDKYVLDYGIGASPSSWTQLASASTTLQYGHLCTWDVSGLDGPCMLRLLVTDRAGNNMTHFVPVEVDNSPPDTPENPSPTDNATGVATTTDFSWNDCARASSYDFYIWPSSEAQPPSPTSEDLTISQYSALGELENGQMYNWQVVASNALGDTSGPVWQFETEGLRLVDFEPKLGLVIGGTILTCEVANLTEHTNLYIGGAPCYRSNVPSNKTSVLSVSTPSMPPGAYQVKVLDEVTFEECVSPETFSYTDDPFIEGADQYPGVVREIEEGDERISTLCGSLPTDAQGNVGPLQCETPEGIIIEIPAGALPEDTNGAFLIARSSERLQDLFVDGVSVPRQTVSPSVDIHLLISMGSGPGAKTYELQESFEQPARIEFPLSVDSGLGGILIGKMETNLDEQFLPILPEPAAITELGSVFSIVNEERISVDVSNFTTYAVLGPGSPGDINVDGRVDAVDVQLVINAALGLNIGHFEGDMNGDDRVDAVDVQSIVNAVLGLKHSLREAIDIR